MTTENLWGSLEEFEKIKTPLSIVREQGELLTQATQGILKGYVKVDSQGDTISFSLFIIAMQLNQYKYEVLKVQHGVKIYPVGVYNLVEPRDRWVSCPSEEIFLTKIKSILSSSETRKIIESLLSQSES